ncbi:MAG: amidohydrolase family protein [Fibrobacteria bacterium]|nr:amidohydrolase family protein [Fibrobacteria bacterium]
MNKNDSLRGITHFISKLPAVSDHDHHLPDDFFAKEVTLDTLFNNSYVFWTGNPSKEDEASRKAILANVSYNSYYTWLQKGIQQVHGISEDVSLDNWERLSGIIKNRYASDNDFHWKALRDNGFKKLIVDAYWEPGCNNGHPDIFTGSFRIDNFTYGYHQDAIIPNDFIPYVCVPWKKYGFAGGTLDDYVDHMRTILTNAKQDGKIVALKCAEAYFRSLNFLPDDKKQAEQVFGMSPKDIKRENFILFSNYIFNRCCEIAGELQIPFQIHTGLARLADSQPMKFLPIIEKYPDVNFVLFHSGYPWSHEICGIVHNYQNAYPSLTWTPTISTSAAVTILDELIDVAPSIRHITWGSDCWIPEEAVGALFAWKFVIAKVIAGRMADYNMSAAKAEQLAVMLLYQNNEEVYGL